MGAVVDMVQDKFRDGTTAHWIGVLEGEDIICAPVQDHLQVINDPQAQANGYITKMVLADHGEVLIPGPPITMSRTPVAPQSPPPELGQHTEDLLVELGYDWDRIGALRDGGVT